MAWTYDASLIQTSPLMQSRYLIGDTLVGDQQLQDEEVNFSLSQYNNIYSACAEMCRTLAAKFARLVPIVQGEIKLDYQVKSRAYKALAGDFEMRGLRGALPIAGGISNSDKQNVAQDPDRVSPAFNRGQFDDTLPVWPVGQQTPISGLPETFGPAGTEFP